MTSTPTSDSSSNDQQSANAQSNNAQSNDQHPHMPVASLEELGELIITIIELRAQYVKAVKKHRGLDSSSRESTIAYEEMEKLRKQLELSEKTLNREVQANFVKKLIDANMILEAVTYEVLGETVYVPGKMWYGNSHDYLEENLLKTGYQSK